jgi:hypothetical protein
MNMRMTVPSQVSVCISPVFTELNPAVRACVDCVNDARMRPPVSRLPMVAALSHSARRKNPVPPTRSTAVMSSVILVCTLQRRGRRRSRRTSRTTGRPSPPTIVATQIGMQIHGSATKSISDSENRAKPALLYAETAWNTPCHSAWPRGAS